LAQYIIRNPFAVEKMQVSPPNRANPAGSVLYRSGLNPKIQRNFEVFSPCDFIAAITQHIPDKSFQLVRYYGWYSNKMRGQRDKRAAQEAKAAVCATNLKQIHLLNTYYADYHDGWIVPQLYNPPGTMYAENFWPFRLGRMMVSRGNELSGELTGSRWQKPRRVFHCPTAEAYNTGPNSTQWCDPYTDWMWRGSDYGLNWLLSYFNEWPSQASYKWIRVTEVEKPAMVYAFADGQSNSSVSMGPGLWPDSIGVPRPRHDDLWNVVLLDGHVERLPDEYYLVDSA
jgi:hypothetical protein